MGFLSTLLGGSSGTKAEDILEQPVDDEELISSPVGMLDRRVIPTLVVKHTPNDRGPSKAHRAEVRAATVCIEYRLREEHPEVAEQIDMYDWQGGANGPKSPTHNRDMLEMAATEWSELAPLGAKTDYTYGGDLRVTFYPIDTTDKFLDAWFSRTDLDREVIQGVIDDFIDDYGNWAGILHTNAMNEAVTYDQTFQQASRMH